MSDNVLAASKIQAGQRLPPDFFTRADVVQIARDLLGRVLVTEFDGLRTAGRITETEAYRAPDDRACHAWNNRRTARTEVMFREGGRAYIYLCYGIHHLFNVVTGPENIAHAVLIRAIEPLEGVQIMMERRGWPDLTKRRPAALTTGPGALSRALGLDTRWNGLHFSDPETPVWIEEPERLLPEEDIISGKRIGVDYAGECAEWPWRFWVKQSPFVKKV
ncbi:MAG: DNA-3-methyladenine glycosylase [Lewinellaceae bacterium]|nr:DNA-3-methyladenine glycosylase [Lewinellaceae bacterium]